MKSIQQLLLKKNSQRKLSHLLVMLKRMMIKLSQRTLLLRFSNILEITQSLDRRVSRPRHKWIESSSLMSTIKCILRSFKKLSKKKKKLMRQVHKLSLTNFASPLRISKDLNKLSCKIPLSKWSFSTQVSRWNNQLPRLLMV